MELLKKLPTGGKKGAKKKAKRISPAQAALVASTFKGKKYPAPKKKIGAMKGNFFDIDSEDREK